MRVKKCAFQSVLEKQPESQTVLIHRRDFGMQPYVTYETEK